MVLALVIGNKLLRGIWKSTTVLWGVWGSVGVLRGVWFPDSGFNRSWDNTGTSDCFKFPIELRGRDDSGHSYFCYIALIVNELGSIQAVGHMLQADQMDQRTTQCQDRRSDERPVGLFGVIGPVDYSMSQG